MTVIQAVAAVETKKRQRLLVHSGLALMIMAILVFLIIGLSLQT